MMRAAQVGKTVLSILLLAGGAALSQDASRKEPSQPHSKQQSSATRDSKKPSLDDATRVDSAVKASSDGAVVELHPARDEAKLQKTDEAPTQNSKKPALDKVHGTVYGSTDSNGGRDRRVGGNVGVTSKSGKTSVFVQTERSRESTSPPH